MHDLSNYEKDIRPWGNYERFTLNEKSTVKIINIKPEATLSLQTHEHREEFWHIISGSGTITLQDKTYEANVGDEFFIETGMVHRAESGVDGMQLLEIAFGAFDEGDIKRLEDKYGRA